MKIMVTGFDPFAGETVNPAWEVVNLLPNEMSGNQIIKVEVPTVFHKSQEVLKQNILEYKPDVVVCIGQAGGAACLRVERVAINQDDARIPDNKGKQPIDCVIQSDGENAYFSTLPIKRIVNDLQKRNIPAQISNSAGTFVCNHLMYQALYIADKEYPQMQVGFVHVPYLPQQVINKPNQPSMSKELMVQALEQIIQTIIAGDNECDVKISGGSIF